MQASKRIYFLLEGVTLMKFLTAADIADQLQVCRTTASKLMLTMHCINVSTTAERVQLRVS